MRRSLMDAVLVFWGLRPWGAQFTWAASQGGGPQTLHWLHVLYSHLVPSSHRDVQDSLRAALARHTRERCRGWEVLVLLGLGGLAAPPQCSSALHSLTRMSCGPGATRLDCVAEAPSVT
jgi:hypothetical protein